MAPRSLVLIAPPVLHASGWWARHVPGKPHLDSLAGHVRDLADVRIVALDAAPDGQAAAERLAEHVGADTGLVGISCWTSLHFLGALAVARQVRVLAPDVPVVVGGHHPSALPSDFLDAGCFDWIVRGDGEHPLRRLCEEWPGRPPEPSVLTGLPFDVSDPARIDWPRYASYAPASRVLWVELSRGCPFPCAFCVEPGRGARWSAHRVGDALDLLERLAGTHAPQVVCFTDPLFGADRAWTERLLAGIEERRLPMMFWAQTRADVMTPALLERFRRCDFKLDFGLDTASRVMVGHMAKSRDAAAYLRRAREILRHANALGLHHDVYLLFNHPGETPDSARETCEFVESLGVGTGPMSGWVSGQSFFILPGTPVYEQMDELAARCGTEVRHPTWWREPRDQHPLATDVLPSAAWRGREHELHAFLDWQARCNADWVARYPTEVHLFRYAFHGGGASSGGGATPG